MSKFINMRFRRADPVGCLRLAGGVVLGAVCASGSAVHAQTLDVSSGTTTVSGQTYSSAAPNATVVHASGTGQIDMSASSVTAGGARSFGLSATGGGSIAVHGGTVTLGDNNNPGGRHRPAAYANNGGTIRIDGGTRIEMGASAGTNPVGSAVMAHSTNGTATQVTIDGATIVQNQTGYISGATRRYLRSLGNGASLVANNVTASVNPADGHASDSIVQVDAGAHMRITNSSLDQATALNVASGARPGPTLLEITNTSLASHADAGIGVLGTSWGRTPPPSRGRTVLTDTAITVHGDAAPMHSVYDAGTYSAGVMADAMSDVAVHGGSITTHGAGSMGVEATDNSAGFLPGAGAVTIDAAGAKGPTRIRTTGAAAHGAYANLGGSIAISGAATIETAGANADGLRASLGDASNPSLSAADVASSSITMTGGSITTTGTGARGASLDGGTSITLQDVAVHAAGPGVAVTDVDGTGSVNSVAITGGTLASGGDAFAVTAADATISVTGTAVDSPDSGTLLRLSGGGNTTFTATGATLRGDVVSDAHSIGAVHLNQGTVLTGMVDPVSLAIDSSSRWNVTADSAVTTLANGGTVAFAAPADPASAASYAHIVANDYVGNNGTIVLHTQLGADGSPSNRLVIDGGTAIGSTTLLVRNTNGTGAPTTGDGIVLVDAINGATTDPNAFRLGAAVSVGAYDYRLHYQNLAKTDQDWYLRSTQGLSPAAQAALPYAETLSNYAQSTLGTLQQRTGHRIWRDGMIDGRGAWGRVVGQSHTRKPKAGSAYSQDLGFLQVGYEGIVAHRPNGQFAAGAYVSVGTSSADIDVTPDPVTGAARPKGKIRSTGVGIGVTGTWLGAGGLYVDAVDQLTWHRSKLSNKSGGRDSGWSNVASVEVGQRFDLGPSWSLVPQAQLAWTHVDFGSYVDSQGNPISLRRGDSLRGRIGVRAEWQPDTVTRGDHLQLYAIANLEHEFLGGTRVSVAGTTLRQRGQRLWGEVGMGFTYAWSKRWSGYAEIEYAQALSGHGSDNHAFKGVAGLRYRW